MTGPIPCILVSGYLGAGKTTLINQFLSAPDGLRAVVLVNDFGRINIDAQLIDNTSENTIELSNGCACCSIGDSLLAATNLAVARRPRPDIIIVEASGVAQPDRMATLLMGASGVAPAQIVTVVDLSQAGALARDKYVARLFLHQIDVAHWLAPNRAPQTPPPAGCPIQTRRAAHAAMGRQVGALTQVIRDPSPAVTKGAQMGAQMGGQMGGRVDFVTSTVAIPPGVTRSELEQWLARLPADIHRVKGFVSIAEAPVSGVASGHRIYQVSKTRSTCRIDPYRGPIPNRVLGQVVLISPRAAPPLDPNEIAFPGP